MAPKATLRILAESLAANGMKADRIADLTGMNPEYARKVLQSLNRLDGVDVSRPTAEDHRAHLQALYDANGYGFAYWPAEIMERFYRLEHPRRPPPHSGGRDE